jgi:hypothetical protein
VGEDEVVFIQSTVSVDRKVLDALRAFPGRIAKYTEAMKALLDNELAMEEAARELDGGLSISSSHVDRFDTGDDKDHEGRLRDLLRENSQFSNSDSFDFQEYVDGTDEVLRLWEAECAYEVKIDSDNPDANGIRDMTLWLIDPKRRWAILHWIADHHASIEDQGPWLSLAVAINLDGEPEQEAVVVITMADENYEAPEELEEHLMSN